MDRRRALMSLSGNQGQIVIISANANDNVKVGEKTYKSSAKVPITEEILVTVTSTKSAISWIVDGSTYSYGNPAVFTARLGHVYTIDAINGTITVEKPKDWDGFIYNGTAKHYPYAALHTDKTPTRMEYTGYDLLLSPLTRSTSSGTQNWGFRLGPIDMTGFKSITITAKNAPDASTTGSGYFKLHLYDFEPSASDTVGGSLSSGYFHTTERTNNITVDLGGRVGDLYVRLSNGYANTRFYLTDIHLNK